MWTIGTHFDASDLRCPGASTEGSQLRFRALPVWSEGQQIGSGAGPHSGAKGLGSAAKRPVLNTPGRSEVWISPEHFEPAFGGTTKMKSMRSFWFRFGDSR
jgi:hypothetical protein